MLPHCPSKRVLSENLLNVSNESLSTILGIRSGGPFLIMFPNLPPWLSRLLLFFAFALSSLMAASATMRAAFPNGLFGSLIDPNTGQADGLELLKNILSLAAGYMLLITLIYQQFFSNDP